jgi:hypothetical protein
MAKFEILDFAFPEFVTCSLRGSEFIRKCCLTDGCKIESSSKGKNLFKFGNGVPEKNKTK